MYSGLFTRVAAFADVINVPRAGYFYCRIIHIKSHEWHQAIFATFARGRLMVKVCARKMVVINVRAPTC